MSDDVQAHEPTPVPEPAQSRRLGPEALARLRDARVARALARNADPEAVLVDGRPALRIPLTMGLHALIDAEDYESVKVYTWHVMRVGTSGTPYAEHTSAGEAGTRTSACASCCSAPAWAALPLRD
jgi:hypothetical protein